MAQIIGEYWNQKEANAYKARKHTKEMKEKYSDEIKFSIDNTKVYSIDFNPEIKFNKDGVIGCQLVDMDSVSAIMTYHSGKTAVLNFASYKEPGGRFIDGSMAQEEALCHESFLYNVLKEKQDYYDWNKNRNLNRAQYKNRALYSPDVIFQRDEETVKCDVITCAAPNITPARKYGWNVSEEENSRNLKDRIKFVLDIAQDNKVDTLILGAYGCGVFGQDPKEVCGYFLEYLSEVHYFKKVIFAVPKSKNGNYDGFVEAMKENE